MKISHLLFMIGLLMIMGIVPITTAQTTDDIETLVGTQWQLVSYGEPETATTSLIPNTAITLEFLSENEIGGSSGCNSYGGNYTIQQNSIAISEIVSTLMACADDATMQQEQTYLEALGSANSYTVTEDTLTILYDNGQQLNFVSTDPNNDNERMLQAVEWSLVSYATLDAETPVLPESNVTINFQENNQVGGNGGCNEYNGMYTVENDTIAISEVVSTLMACADEAVTQQEVDFLAALNSATRYEITNNALHIWFDNGQARLNFEYRGQDADILEGSMWQLDSYGDPNAPIDVIPDSNVTLNFETDTHIEGNGGCNTYSGDYQTVATLVSFSQLTHTELACADQAVTNQEQVYFDALASATEIEGFFDRLVITYPDGQLNFTIVPN